MPPEQDKQNRFLAAYAKVHEGFMRYCSALSFARMDTEDLVQDVLLSAYNKFDALDEPEKLQHYLVRAARNRSVSLKRKRARTQVRGIEGNSELSDTHRAKLAAKGASPEQLADVEILYKAIHRLPDAQRDAILLYEISGYPQVEIAELLDCSVPAVKMLLQRGRKRLRRLLTDPGHRLSDLLTTAKSITL